VPISPLNAATLRLALSSRFDRPLLAEHTRLHPGMAFTTQDGRQYVIAGPWRHRDDIAELLEATRGSLREDLHDRLLGALADQGYRLVVLDYGLETKDADFYRYEQFQLVERILEFDRPDLPVPVRPVPGGVDVRAYRSDDRESVLAVERDSFPWLWWNSEEEWDRYVATPGVEIYVGACGEDVVAYAGFVVHRRNGHLDRLAVRDTEQGRGLGATLLLAALARMAARGAKQVSLTTQEHNVRSQRLYEKYGFRRGRWTYEIHGRWLRRARMAGS
jgi:ribosomal protein S18 acetylase RimI-like enzyme